MPASSGNAQSSSSIITPRSAACALSSGQFEHLQDHRLIWPQHFAGGDPEEEGVADLAGGAGDGDADGCFHERLLAVGMDTPRWNAAAWMWRNIRRIRSTLRRMNGAVRPRRAF